MGTPDFAVASLQAICQAGHEVVGVVTVPDRPTGRGLKMTASPVKQYALEHSLPLLQPEKLRDPDFQKSLRQWDPLQPIAADDQQKNDLFLGILRRKRAANGWCE